jgi:hypothetical protein
MACGSDAQKRDLWQTLNEQVGEIPLEIVEALIREAVPENVEQIMVSLGKLPIQQSMNSFLLNHTLHDYIERLGASKAISELTHLTTRLDMAF